MTMVFSGVFKPISTIDWYGRSVSVIFFNGCNFKCVYCSNVEFILRESQKEPFGRKEIGKKAKNEYLFKWDEIPGFDNTKLINFLKQNYDLDWGKSAIIKKTNHETIKVFTEKYLFNWDEISGNDSEKVIEVLRQDFGIDWAKRAKIHKIDDGKTIRVSTKEKSLQLKFNNVKTTVSLKIDNFRTQELNTKNENGKLNVYKVNSLSLELNTKYLFSWDDIPGNDTVRLIGYLRRKYDVEWVETALIEKIYGGKSIKLYSKNHHISLKLEDEINKVSVEIDDHKIDEFIPKRENGKLRIYKITKVSLKIDDGRTEELRIKVKEGKLYVYGELKFVLNPLEPTFKKEHFVDIIEIEKQILDTKSFISAVVFSGGEPTAIWNLEGLEHLAGFVKSQGLLVGIETNGYYPERLEKLIERKLIDKIFLDVKAPLGDAERYSVITRVNRDNRDAAERVRRSLNLKGVPIEVRTTVFSSFAADIPEIAKSIAGRNCTYVIQQGIPEYAPDENIRKEKPLTRDELATLAGNLTFLKDVRIRTREKGEERIIHKA